MTILRYFTYAQFGITALLLGALCLPMWGSVRTTWGSADSAIRCSTHTHHSHAATPSHTHKKQPQVRRFVLRLVDSVLFYKVRAFGNTQVTLYALLLGVSVLELVIASYEYHNSSGRFQARRERAGAVEDSVLMVMYRNQRNWWVSAFSVTLWLLLARVRTFIVDLNDADHRIKELEAAATKAVLHAVPVAAAPAGGALVATVGAAGPASGDKPIATAAAGMTSSSPAGVEPSAPPAAAVPLPVKKVL